MLIRPPSGKKVLWQEMLRHELLAALEQRPVVIVPVGSVEQHGPHCPQDVDISIPYHLAIARRRRHRRLPGDRGAAGDVRLHPLQHGRGRHDHARPGDLHRRALRCLPLDLGERVPPHHPAQRARRQRGSRPGPPRSSWPRRMSGRWRSPTGTWRPTSCWPGARPTRAASATAASGKPACSSICAPTWSTCRWRSRTSGALKFSPEVQRYALFPERRREMAHGVMGDPFVASAEKGRAALRCPRRAARRPLPRVPRDRAAALPRVRQPLPVGVRRRPPARRRGEASASPQGFQAGRRPVRTEAGAARRPPRSSSHTNRRMSAPNRRQDAPSRAVGEPRSAARASSTMTVSATRTSSRNASRSSKDRSPPAAAAS